MLVKGGPLWFTRWAHDVGLEHRDLRACAGESPASGTPSTSLLDLNTLLPFHGKPFAQRIIPGQTRPLSSTAQSRHHCSRGDGGGGLWVPFILLIPTWSLVTHFGVLCPSGLFIAEQLFYMVSAPSGAFHVISNGPAYVFRWITKSMSPSHSR